MGDLSAHFSRSEFRCRHCGALPPSRQLRHLVEHCERLRAIAGGPLVVVSGYRCPRHPVEVAKRRPGAHYAPGAIDVKAGYCTPQQAWAAGFLRVGVKGRDGPVIHVDLKTGGPRLFVE